MPVQIPRGFGLSTDLCLTKRREAARTATTHHLVTPKGAIRKGASGESGDTLVTGGKRGAML